MLKQLTLPIMIILLLMPVALASPVGIRMQIAGFGPTGQEVYVSFTNIGDKTVTGITVSVDGKLYKNIQANLGPGDKIENVIYLENGNHVLQAITSQGYHDSLTVTIAAGQKESQPQASNPSANNILNAPGGLISVSMIAILAACLVVLWIFIRQKKP